MLRWKKTVQHSDRGDVWSTDVNVSAKGHVEYISTKKKGDRDEEDEKTFKKVKNKRARFIEIANLNPDTEYQIWTSFVYTKETLAMHLEQGGTLHNGEGEDGKDWEVEEGEGEKIGPLTIRTAQGMLICSL